MEITIYQPLFREKVRVFDSIAFKNLEEESVIYLIKKFTIYKHIRGVISLKDHIKREFLTKVYTF